MVIVYLNKDLRTGKMLVTKWIVMSKEKAIDYPNIPGYRVAFVLRKSYL